MAVTSDLSRGSFIRYNGDLVQITEFQHRTPGNLRAFYQVKMRSVKSGKTLENRFRPDESVDVVRVEVREYQYLYKDGNQLVVMDNGTFEQINIDESLLGDQMKFLKEEMTLKISFDEETPLSAEMQQYVDVEVTYTEPGLAGDTATRTLKPATIETGAEIRVPLFVSIGDKVRVNTQSGEYMERVK
jgi:elongation factor P